MKEKKIFYMTDNELSGTEFPDTAVSRGQYSLNFKEISTHKQQVMQRTFLLCDAWDII